jgi:hypothetical protein
LKPTIGEFPPSAFADAPMDRRLTESNFFVESNTFGSLLHGELLGVEENSLLLLERLFGLFSHLGWVVK